MFLFVRVWASFVPTKAPEGAGLVAVTGEVPFPINTLPAVRVESPVPPFATGRTLPKAGVCHTAAVPDVAVRT